MIARLEQLGVLEDDVILLDEAALILSGLDDPDRDITACRRELTDISERTRLASRAASTAREQAAVLAAILGDDEGFTGDTHDYDNPANADLAQLLDRRRGLPVTLAILYVAQARRLGWAATALNTPGHILVRIGHETDRSSSIRSETVPLSNPMLSRRCSPACSDPALRWNPATSRRWATGRCWCGC